MTEEMGKYNFRRGLSPQFKEENKYNLMMTKVKSALEEVGIRIDSLEIWRHREKLATITGESIHNSGLGVEMMQKLREKNFVWIVDEKFISRFPYAATVRSPRGIELVESSKTAYRPQRYIGDIPEATLDRMQEAIALGINYFTIHSMQPMPTYQVFSDPVLIGWASPPRMRWEGERVSSSTKMICDYPCRGIVIGMWNAKAEEEAL